MYPLLFNLAIVWAIVHFFYYPKGRRRDYYFTFILLSISIFMLIYLMDGSNLQIGAALGLFAVFGIIRYRTESVPIREMTYLFFLVALSVLNGTKADLSLVERLAANLLLLTTVWGAENYLLVSRVGCKFVRYDNIDLIVPERYEELKADLEKRLGLKNRARGSGRCRLPDRYDHASRLLRRPQQIHQIGRPHFSRYQQIITNPPTIL